MRRTRILNGIRESPSSLSPIESASGMVGFVTQPIIALPKGKQESRITAPAIDVPRYSGPPPFLPSALTKTVKTLGLGGCTLYPLEGDVWPRWQHHDRALSAQRPTINRPFSAAQETSDSRPTTTMLYSAPPFDHPRPPDKEDGAHTSSLSANSAVKAKRERTTDRLLRTRK